MRLLLSSLVAASLLTGPVVAAECARPLEHTALDLTALKTQLMVIALTCREDDRYNAFVTKYRPDLTAADKSLAGYFARGSRNGAKMRDDYVTQLANAQSQIGLKQGSAYCGNLTAFDEVMALKNNTELQEYAASKAFAEQPILVQDCGAGPERATHSSARSTARRRS